MYDPYFTPGKAGPASYGLKAHIGRRLPPCALSPGPRSLPERLVALSKSLPHLTSASPTHGKVAKGRLPLLVTETAPPHAQELHTGFPSSAPEDTASLPSPLLPQTVALSHSHCAEISWLPRDLSETFDAMSHSQHLGHLC